MMKSFLRKIRSFKQIFPILKSEVDGFYKSDKEKLSYRTLMPCHTVEKGMALKNYEPGHGKKAVNEVLNRMSEFSQQDIINNYPFLECVSVISCWLDIQETADVDVKLERARFEEQLNRFEGIEYSDFIKAAEDMVSGASFINKEYLLEKSHAQFADLAKNRHSIRAFSNEEITREELMRVIKTASYAPSACNRQPVKVYTSLDADKNNTISKYVPGNKEFENDVPYYMIVTSNREYFGDSEFCQWFVNGGIALAYITLSMFSEGIGSCIFQWPSNYPGECELKKLSGISEAESICGIIGYGKLPEKVKVIGACRKPVDDYLKIF